MATVAVTLSRLNYARRWSACDPRAINTKWQSPQHPLRRKFRRGGGAAASRRVFAMQPRNTQYHFLAGSRRPSFLSRASSPISHRCKYASLIFDIVFNSSYFVAPPREFLPLRGSDAAWRGGKGKREREREKEEEVERGWVHL